MKRVVSSCTVPVLDATVYSLHDFGYQESRKISSSVLQKKNSFYDPIETKFLLLYTVFNYSRDELSL